MLVRLEQCSHVPVFISVCQMLAAPTSDVELAAKAKASAGAAFRKAPMALTRAP